MTTATTVCPVTASMVPTLASPLEPFAVANVPLPTTMSVLMKVMVPVGIPSPSLVTFAVRLIGVG